MKVKKIEKIINNKFDHFLKSIKDEEIKKLIDRNTIISGGCIASMLLNEDVNDYDLYFTDQETTFKVAEYFVNKYASKNKTPIIVEKDDNRVVIKVKSSGIAKDSNYKYFAGTDELNNALLAYTGHKNVKQNYKPIFITSNAITLSGDIQLILRFYGSPETIHKNFDYVHATNYWTSKDRKININKEAIESLLTKELKYIGSLYPICSIFRLRKFIKRGFTINAGQLLKIMWQVNELDLCNENVLIEQLIGVDILFMFDLLQRLQNKEDIDYTYIAKVVDEIF